MCIYDGKIIFDPREKPFDIKSGKVVYAIEKNIGTLIFHFFFESHRIGLRDHEAKDKIGLACFANTFPLTYDMMVKNSQSALWIAKESDPVLSKKLNSQIFDFGTPKLAKRFLSYDPVNHMFELQMKPRSRDGNFYVKTYWGFEFKFRPDNSKDLHSELDRLKNKVKEHMNDIDHQFRKIFSE